MRFPPLALALMIWAVAPINVYGQGPISVPGKIEVEQYDSFFDTTPGNAYGGCRADAVDLESSDSDRPDLPTNCRLRSTRTGEWIGFTINVSEAATYVLSVRVRPYSVDVTGGGTFHVEVDGVDVSGAMRVPYIPGDIAPGWWTTMFKHGIGLTAGQHTLKLKMDSESPTSERVGMFNYLALTRTVPFEAQPFAVPGTIEAENFDRNPSGAPGETFAYHDWETANVGNAGYYRPGEAVDIWDGVPGQRFIDMTTGEWIAYTVNIGVPGRYSLSLRVVHPGVGGRLHFELDGNDITGPITIPDTGGYPNWQTIEVTTQPLPTGVHVLTVVGDQESSLGVVADAIDYFTFVAAPFNGNVTWTDLVNVTVDGTVLRKTGGCDGCEDAGARSVEEIASGDGYIEFTVGETNTIWYAGLSNGNTDTSFADIDFAFRFNGAGLADVKENGVYKGGDTAYAVGDVFRVAVVGNQVYYRRNGELLYVSQITPTYPLLLDTSLTTLGATIHNAKMVGTSGPSGGPGGEDGGLLEDMGTPHGRKKSFFKPPNPWLSFVPSQKDPVQFPAPYNTKGARLTDATDCGGSDCVWYVGYSYWRRMNYHVENPTWIYILLGLEAQRGGTGPTIFGYNKTNRSVTNMGPLFPATEPDAFRLAFRAETAEMWYFSARGPTTLYAMRTQGTQLIRFKIVIENNRVLGTGTALVGSGETGAPEIAMDLAVCRNGGQCPPEAAYISHPHSSDDDRVHVAMVRRIDTAHLGCMVYEAVEGYRYFVPEANHELDECALDKSGRWLILNEGGPDDQIVIDLHNQFAPRYMRDDAGAHTSHADLGYGYSVGPDNFLPNHSTTLLKFPIPLIQIHGDRVHYNSDGIIDDANHVSHTNADVSLTAEQQYACGSNASPGDHRDEIVCFSLHAFHDDPPKVLVVAPVMTDQDSVTAGDGAAGPVNGQPNRYARFPKGNLDVTGEYFIWTANLYGRESRLDAFIVKVPKCLLVSCP